EREDPAGDQLRALVLVHADAPGGAHRRLGDEHQGQTEQHQGQPDDPRTPGRGGRGRVEQGGHGCGQTQGECAGEEHAPPPGGGEGGGVRAAEPGVTGAPPRGQGAHTEGQGQAEQVEDECGQCHGDLRSKWGGQGSGAGGDAQEVVAADAGAPGITDVQPVAAQLGEELARTEPVGGGVVEQRPVGGAGQGGGGDLVEEEPAAGGQDAGDLGQGVAPVRDVVDDREVEHRVVGGVLACADGGEGGGQVGGRAAREVDALAVALKAPPCSGQHFRVQVHGVHGRGAEGVQDEPGAVAGAAAQLGGAGAGGAPAQLDEQVGLVVLEQAPGR